MVHTRACTMDSEKGKKNQNKNKNKNKNKNRTNNSGNEKSKMKPDSKSPPNNSNPESEEDDQNTPLPVLTPLELAGSSIKVTLKKTRTSRSSSSSRESTQSFEVVRTLPPTAESVSGEEDCENPKDPEPEKTNDKSPSVDDGENEKESEGESQNANSFEDSDVEILSDDSQVSFTERSSPAVSVKSEDKNVSINTVIDLKTEDSSQNSTVVKKEECKAQVKTLKEELLKESDLDGDVVVLKDDDENDDTQVPQPQNDVEKKEFKEQAKEQVKEQKVKINVRSFDDLVDPRTAILINMPPPADRATTFLPQNGGSFPPPYLSCDVCGVQYDSPELLNDHKVTMKHFKCSFKECEHIAISSQQEFLDHQRLAHNVMPSPVQQLAHQVQRLPAMGFDQQLQSGVPPLPENLSPSMYTQSLRMPNQPVPMQRAMRPMMRPTMPHMISPRGRNVQRGSAMRGRIASLNSTPRGSSLKRPITTPRRGTPPMKRTNLDRNSYATTMNKTPQIVKSIAESLTKSVTKNLASPASQQDVVNLFSKRGLTISTVDNGHNSNIPAGLSLNSAVSIIPTSPHKVPNNVPNKVSNKVSNSVSNTVSKHVPRNILSQSMDTVDLTGPDKPKTYFPCEICSKTYSNSEKMYEHISVAHKSVSFPYKCNSCQFVSQSLEKFNRHKLTHKSEINNASMVIPIVDLSKSTSIFRLKQMGITNYIPIAQMDNQGGQFGVPIMTSNNRGAQEGLNCTSYFNFGNVRHLP